MIDNFNAAEFGKLYRSLSDTEKLAFIDSLTPEQAYAIENLWEFRARESQIPIDGNWFTYLYCTGRGYGKQLDIHTPIPTPSGWTTMGEIRVGDEVFDENGKICRVTEVFPIEIPEIAYRIHFSDGSFIDACSEHQWVTLTQKEFVSARFPEWVSFGKVRTTNDIVKTFHQTHCIPKSDGEIVVITGFRSLTPVPMRCISVDSPNSMYLAGKSMIPTHNTLSLTGWADGKARQYPGCRMAFVAPTAADARDVLVQGDSGVQSVAPKWDVPKYSPSYRRVEWSNGSKAWLYSAEESERLRGPQHHFGIADELRAWVDLETWDNLIFGMRLGDKPQIVSATTPKPSSLVKSLLDDPSVIKVFGSTFENADNLAKPFLEKLMEKYSGTRLGDQEIEGKLLEDLIGALWKSWMFDMPGFRANEHTLPPLARKAVAIDPAVSTNRNSNQTGIVVGGVENKRLEGRSKALKHFYVLEDLSQSTPPHIWAQSAVDAFYQHDCDFIVAEVNNGGNLVTEIISTIDPNVPVKTVRASVGKEARAEPISAFYAQGRAHHFGVLKEAEDQMLNWIPGQGVSPDIVDAISWLGHSLMLDEQEEAPMMRRAIAKFSQKISW